MKPLNDSVMATAKKALISADASSMNAIGFINLKDWLRPIPKLKLPIEVPSRYRYMRRRLIREALTAPRTALIFTRYALRTCFIISLPRIEFFAFLRQFEEDLFKRRVGPLPCDSA